MNIQVPVPNSVTANTPLGSIEDKIVELLTIYPKLNPTMLQAGLGPSLSPKLWRPVLDDLISRATVIAYTLNPPAGSPRTQAYKVLELAEGLTPLDSIAVPPPPSA